MALTQEFTTLAGAVCVGAVAMATPAAAALAPVLIPLTAMAAMGLHLKDGCAKKACDKAQKAIFKALKGQPEFPPETLTRAISLLKDAASPLNLSSETLLAAAKSGAFEAEVVQHMLAPLTLDKGESAVQIILESALLAGLGACRKDKSFNQALTQELLIEAAHVANVQLELLVEIKSDTTKIKAQLDQNTDILKQLLAGKVPQGLTLEQLHALAAQFKVVVNEGDGPATILQNLTNRAQEINALEQRLEKLQSQFPQLGNAIAEARAKLELGDTQAVRKMVRDARVVLRDAKLLEALEQDAQLVEIDASALLIEGDAEAAFTHLSAAADSFAGIIPLAPSQRRVAYADILYQHGLRYGGTGMVLAITMLKAALEPLSFEHTPELWASAQNNLGNALSNQALHTEGLASNSLLGGAVQAYRDALTVRTKAEHPVDWAGTQNNLAVALQAQALRTEGSASTALLGDAVQAYRDALTVYTKAEHPVDWAMTQNNLAIALKNQALRTEGPASTTLLGDAVQAYRDALTVRTKAEHPVHWAMTKENLAILEEVRAQQSGCQDPRSHLEAALAYVEAALTVFDPVHTAYNHTKANRLREDLLKALSADD